MKELQTTKTIENHHFSLEACYGGKARNNILYVDEHPNLLRALVQLWPEEWEGKATADLPFVHRTECGRLRFQTGMEGYDKVTMYQEPKKDKYYYIREREKRTLLSRKDIDVSFFKTQRNAIWMDLGCGLTGERIVDRLGHIIDPRNRKIISSLAPRLIVLVDINRENPKSASNNIQNITGFPQRNIITVPANFLTFWNDQFIGVKDEIARRKIQQPVWEMSMFGGTACNFSPLVFSGLVGNIANEFRLCSETPLQLEQHRFFAGIDYTTREPQVSNPYNNPIFKTWVMLGLYVEFMRRSLVDYNPLLVACDVVTVPALDMLKEQLPDFSPHLLDDFQNHDAAKAIKVIFRPKEPQTLQRRHGISGGSFTFDHDIISDPITRFSQRIYNGILQKWGMEIRGWRGESGEVSNFEELYYIVDIGIARQFPLVTPPSPG